MWLRKEKKKLKSLVRFHTANKIDNRGVGGKEKKEEKSQRIYRTSQNMRIINVFLLYCQSPFPHWESQSTSPP